LFLWKKGSKPERWLLSTGGASSDARDGVTVKERSIKSTTAERIGFSSPSGSELPDLGGKRT